MNYSDNQIRDALTKAAEHDEGININGDPGEEQWSPYELESLRRILAALDATTTHPDPSRHPFILVTGYDDHTDDGVLLDEARPYVFDGEFYVTPDHPALEARDVTDWVPAEMVAKNV